MFKTNEYLKTLGIYGPLKDFCLLNNINNDFDMWNKINNPNLIFELVKIRNIKLNEGKLRLFACDCAEKTSYICPQYKNTIDFSRLYAEQKIAYEELKPYWEKCKSDFIATFDDSARSAIRYCADKDIWTAVIGSVRHSAWASRNCENEWIWQANRFKFYFSNPFKRI